ncbi:MAG: helix-turn-helix domain-containing protein [Planctomycetes bacterium]|nr:helix-turn-helix domain-containing protein [Planctomycetota bacterium]
MLKPLSSNQHPVTRLADRLDDVVVAGHALERAWERRPRRVKCHRGPNGEYVIEPWPEERSFTEAVEAARAGVVGVDPFIRSALRTNAGEWTSSLLGDLSAVGDPADAAPPFGWGDDELYRRWRGKLEGLRRKSRILRDIDLTAFTGRADGGAGKAITSDGHCGRLLTVRALAVYLSVAEQTVRNHAHDIPGRKRLGSGERGGRVLYDRETIDRWIEKGNAISDLWLAGRRMLE